MSDIPPVKENINWDNVIETTKKHMKNVFDSSCPYEGDKQYVFEAVVEAMYGKEIWDKYNDKL